MAQKKTSEQLFDNDAEDFVSADEGEDELLACPKGKIPEPGQSDVQPTTTEMISEESEEDDSDVFVSADEGEDSDCPTPDDNSAHKDVIDAQADVEQRAKESHLGETAASAQFIVDRGLSWEKDDAFSTFIDKTGLQVVFHLVTHKVPECVTLTFENNLKFKLKFASKHGSVQYWKSEPIKKEDIEYLSYKYEIRYYNKIKRRKEKKETGSDRQISSDCQNQYDVFNETKEESKPDRIFEGQLFYVTKLYDLLSEDGATCNPTQTMQDIEHTYTRLADQLDKSSSKNKKSFSKWLTEQLKKVTPFIIAAICSLLGHRNIQKGELLRSIITDHKIADNILDGLRRCKRSLLPQSTIQNIHNIHTDLLQISSLCTNMHYIFYFHDFFGGQFDVIRNADRFPNPNDANLLEIASVLVKDVMIKEETQHNMILLKFILSKFDNNYPMLCKMFQELPIDNNLNAYNDVLIQHFVHRRLPITQSFWEDTPHVLRPKLAGAFVDELGKEVLQKSSWNELDTELIVSLMHDKDLQKQAPNEMMILLKLLSKSAKMNVVVDVLKSQSFLSFWNERNKEDREEVARNIASTVSQSSATNVASTISSFDAVSQITALKDYAEDIEKYVCKELSSFDFRTIVKACCEIYQRTGQSGRKCLMTLLIKCLQKEHPDSSAKSQLLDVMFTSPSGTQSLNIDRNQVEILILLMNQAEIAPIKSPSLDNVRKVVSSVLLEKQLWKVIFEVSAQKQQNFFKKNLVYSTVTSVMKELRTLLINLHVTFDFVKNDNDIKELIEFLSLGPCFLQESSTSADDCASHNFKKLLEDVLLERKNIQEKFDLLKEAIHFSLDVTRGQNSITLTDANAISHEYNHRLKNLAQKTFSEIREDIYWGQLECLVDPAKRIQSLFQSSIFKKFFRNLSKAQIHDVNLKIKNTNTPGATKGKQQRENTLKVTVQEFIVLLGDNVQAFQDVFEQITDKEGHVTPKDLDNLIDANDTKNIQEELEHVSNVLGTGIPLIALQMLRTYVQFDDFKSKIGEVDKCLHAIGYSSDSCRFLQNLKSFLDCKQSGTLKSITDQMNEPGVMKVYNLCPDLVETLTSLSDAKELVDFIVKTDSVIDLMEVVEEYSEDIVQAKTVSDLVDVHQCLKETLSNKAKEPEEFLNQISEAYANLPTTRGCMTEIKEPLLARKIKKLSCNVHTLESLKTVANRGEKTKKIIKSAIEKGCYEVRITPDGSATLQLKYSDKKCDAPECNFDQLIDLKCQALLMVNAETSHNENIDGQTCKISQDDLNSFIEQIDCLMEIIRIYKLSVSSGMPEFLERDHWACLHVNDNNAEIKREQKSASEKLDTWKKMMRRIRGKHFFLNFFHTKQLWKLKSFFRDNLRCEEGAPDDVLSLFRFIDGNINRNDLTDYQSRYERPNTTSPENELRAIGSALENIFRTRYGDNPTFQSPLNKIDAVVEPNKLYVGVLEPNSVLTVHVIMALYENTCKCLPKPSQLLFCTPKTTLGEIELFLLRTFKASQHEFPSKLHCIANVERLSKENQSKLAKTINSLKGETNANYLLAIICRGGSHHQIANQFAENVHYHDGLPDQMIKSTFEKERPFAFFVTTDLPGLGKSEKIYSSAGEAGKTVVTFPISGPFARESLVKRLSSLNLESFHALHFDVGEVDDPQDLDTFLFELVATKVVASESLIFCLPTDHVYIEVANTLQQSMRNSLPICKCFKHLDVEWQAFDNLLVSREVTSPIQIVCQYLRAYECGTLEQQEIILYGPKKVKPLEPMTCQTLLKRHFIPDGDGSRHGKSHDLSFDILETFISVLAVQLQKFSKIPHFKPEILKSIIGAEHDIRKPLFEALLNSATCFATRSISTCQTIQLEALSNSKGKEVLKKMKAGGKATADQMVDRVKGMVRWSETEQFFIMLNCKGSCTALCKDLEQIPQHIRDLFKSQAVFGTDGLKECSNMSQEELQLTLEIFTDAPVNQNKEKLRSLNYALTPDNLMKMILITQRMQASIPVIIMGETGCGKTSLVRYLALSCGIPFVVFSMHAGIQEKEIIDFISSKDKEARKLQKEGKSMWIFLDEINTCDYLGTVNEIICHHRIQGKPLPLNLKFVAACNPYRLRQYEPNRMADGLTVRKTVDEISKLVYRVYPLPETMIDYVWDYGLLSSEDERVYIARMVGNVVEDAWCSLLVELLATSQEFIRNEDRKSSCVSLRDVNRAIILMKWFLTMLKERQAVAIGGHPEHLHKYFFTAERFSDTEKAIVLTLAHCYLSRLQTKELRISYCQRMTEIFIKNGRDNFSQIQDSFQHIIRAEQEEFLSRMELPHGTANNAALRENVFVILVCILNRIPVFVVGKPGCSKSLSMQIIKSNLRGRDSKDAFLKTLPKLWVVSFQGSESSTSEGVEKAYEKAKSYKSKPDNVLPVLLLDEIGLAEKSNSNPLKVLHSLLELGLDEVPDVAVVGISNWALDPAKMNRAVHLSRPEPEKDDLYETGLCIRNAQGSRKAALSDVEVHCLAEAYYEYQSGQHCKNFHGLRDYYSMVKSLSSEETDKNCLKIQRALQRNFGGMAKSKSELQLIFNEKLGSFQPTGNEVIFQVTDLIKDNLNDIMARHLMIITSGNSALAILEQSLKNQKKEKITIFGSQFDKDRSSDYSDYNHRVLSRIIFFMEHPCILILLDLDSIYGSLYDLLNQNYMVVGGQKYCRIALGAYSSPMCQVNDEFRCIVVVDENKVDYSDPPFLNRFEKQVLRFSDVVDQTQRIMIEELQCWVKKISTVPNHEAYFNEKDMFAGYHKGTLPSLVLFYNSDSKVPRDKVIARCKDDLMSIAIPEAVIRSRYSELNQINEEEVNRFYDEYLKKPIHGGLKKFLENAVQQDNSYSRSLLVMTHSSVHTDISTCVDGLLKNQTEIVSSLKSEKEIRERFQDFWREETTANLLIVKCTPETDSSHMLLVKSIIDEQRKAYYELLQRTNIKKHVCIIVHLGRSAKKENHLYYWQFNFLDGVWSQFVVECLEKPNTEIRDTLNYSIRDVFRFKTFKFTELAADQLRWCFTRLKFPPQRLPYLDDISSLEETIARCDDIMGCFKELCCSWIENQQEGSDATWQIKVACDQQALINSSTLVNAMKNFIMNQMRLPLARIIYFLQKHSAFQGLTSKDAATRQECLRLLSKESIFNINSIQEPQGPESYVIDHWYPDLRFPFSYLFCMRVDSLYCYFSEESRNMEDSHHENRELSSDEERIIVKEMAEKVKIVVPEIIESPLLLGQLDSYINDFLDMKTDEVSDVLSRDQRIDILKAHYGETMPDSDAFEPSYVVAQLHCNYWFDGNIVPQVFHFIKDCMAIGVLSTELLNCLTKRYKSIAKNNGVPQEEHYNMGVAGYSSSVNDETSQRRVCKREPVENNDRSKQPKEHDDWDSFKFPVQATQEDSDEVQIPREIASEDVNENGNLQDPPYSFDDYLVHEVCLSHLRHKGLLEKTGINEWLNVAELVISSATKYCFPVPAICYYLRVCSDFAKLNLAEKENFLSKLAELGTEVDDGSYLNSVTLFNAVVKLVEDVRGSHEDDTILKGFLLLFYERCIQSTDADSQVRKEILRKLSLSDDKDALPLVSSLLSNLIIPECDERLTVVAVDKLITSEMLLEFPNLMAINDILSKLKDNGNELDCQINVICCDLINKLAFRNISVENLTCSDHSAVKTFHKAMNTLTESAENCENVLGFICAISYVRAFISAIARALDTRHTPSMDHLLRDVCKRLDDKSKAQAMKVNIWLYFLKELDQVMCLYDVSKLIRELLGSLCEDHPLKSIELEGTDACKLEYNPFKHYETDSQATLDRHITGEEIIECLDGLVQSSEDRLAFAALMVEHFYLVRSHRKLKDTEDNLARRLTELLINVTPPYKNYISRIAGQHIFKYAKLEISQESNAIDVEVVMLIQHLSAVLTSRFTEECKNPIMCCLVNSTVLQESYIVSVPDNSSRYPQYRHHNTSSLKDAPGCHSSNKGNVRRTQEKPSQSKKGYITCNVDSLKSEMIHVRNLDPIEFRILHVIVHVALLAGYSLDLSTGVLIDDDNPTEICYNIIQVDLNALGVLLCCKTSKVITLLHQVIMEMTPFLTEESNIPLPHNEEQRLLWERDYSSQVQPLIKSFCSGGLSTCVDHGESIPLNTLIEKHQLSQRESTNVKSTNVPRLFRVTQPNTFNKLREVYLNSTEEIKEQHQLLGLFLDYHETLGLVSNLFPLITWTRRVSILLSRQVTRLDAQRVEILKEVFRREEHLAVGEQSASARENSTRREFEKFKRAWRKSAAFVNERIEDDEVPAIAERSALGYCLADKKGLGRFLQVILISLAELQNEFLEKCMDIATSGKCLSLHFISKGKSSQDYTFPMVHLQDAKQKEIIHYDDQDWTDRLLELSYSPTEYGQERNISYDMKKIEKELAGRFLLGKTFLETSIREFNFSEDTPHECAETLSEIFQTIPQEKLPNKVRKELQSSVELGMDRIQTLLGDLELVLCSMKRIEIKAEDSFATFIKTWMSGARTFPKDLFPTTLSMIHMEHVCDLYEFVEDQLAFYSIECVGQQYLKKLENEHVKMLRSQSQGFTKEFVDEVLSVIKRFAFRYLLRSKPNPEFCLLKYMEDPSLWSMDLRLQKRNPDFKVSKAAPMLFPEQLTVGQTYEVYQFYHNLIQEFNQTHSRTSLRPTPPRPPPKKRKGGRQLFA